MTPDPTFGNNGYLTHSAGTIDVATAVSVLPDGKLLVGGFLQWCSSCGIGFAVLRLTETGQVDPSFGRSGVGFTDFRAWVRLYEMAVEPDGGILLLGCSGLEHFRSSQVALARFTADGQLDPSFSRDGKAMLSLGSLYDCAPSLARTPATGDYILAGYASVRAFHPQPPVAALAKLRHGVIGIPGDDDEPDAVIKSKACCGWSGQYLGVDPSTGAVGMYTSDAPNTRWRLRWEDEVLRFQTLVSGQYSGWYLNISTTSGTVKLLNRTSHTGTRWSQEDASGFSRLVSLSSGLYNGQYLSLSTTSGTLRMHDNPNHSGTMWAVEQPE